MKYSYEYKRMCVELYRQGKWPETPEGIQKENFRKMIRRWTRIEKFMWGKNGQPNKAFERFPSVNGLIMHSDQGWQYRHAAYRTEIQKHKIIQSMSRKGNCYDNCVKETFFGRLKNEMFYGCEKEYTTFAIFSKAISDYIDYYNNRRIQPKTKRMPPAKLREASMMRN